MEERNASTSVESGRLLNTKAAIVKIGKINNNPCHLNQTRMTRHDTTITTSGQRTSLGTGRRGLSFIG